MDEKEWGTQLEREGLSHIYIWKDRPEAFYPNHSHGADTEHIILSCEMTLTMNRLADTYRAGDRCDVPAGAVHSAKMGAKGCRYLIGER